jgi:hypothetical protein
VISSLAFRVGVVAYEKLLGFAVQTKGNER